MKVMCFDMLQLALWGRHFGNSVAQSKKLFNYFSTDLDLLFWFGTHNHYWQKWPKQFWLLT